MPGIERDRLGLGRGAHHVHQAGARPVGGGVEAGARRLLAGLAVGGDRAVDQPRVDRQQVGGGDLQALAHRQREIGDEDVGRADQALQHAQALAMLEVDREAALVARRQLPPVVGDLARHRRRGPPRIAGARRLDLDHLGAEVREDGRRRGPAIQLAQSITFSPANIPSASDVKTSSAIHPGRAVRNVVEGERHGDAAVVAHQGA
jgi:hypothetical protein